MANLLSHAEYKIIYDGKRVDYDGAFAYQCVDLARHYCKEVRGYQTGVFGGTAYKGWINRATTFVGCDSITGFALAPIGSVVIFKPYAVVFTKKSGTLFWKKVVLTSAGHVGIVDYIDSQYVIRLLEQNGATGTGSGLGGNAIRLWGYQSKDAIAGFILQPKKAI